MTMPLDELEAIKQLKARYFRLLDTKDWAGFREVFTDDVVIDTTGAGGGVVTGTEEFLDFLSVTLADTVTVHQGHMPEIQLTAPDEAIGIWALHDILIWANGTRMDGFGHYHERYRKGADGWRIASLTLTRLHTEMTSPVTS
jgi:uncharacterized protein (TIGR02246 family)